MDSELEQFKRQINLTEYAASLGYQLQPRESTKNGASIVMRHPGTDDKIVIARRESDGHWIYFSVRDRTDNGSIVDFALRRTGQSLGHVRRDLRDWLGEDRPRVAPEAFRADVPPQKTDRAAVQVAYATTTHEATNSLYLNFRGIRPETLTCDRFRGTWRIDQRGNVVFPHTDEDGLSGFEMKNQGFTGFSARGTKTAWRSNGLPEDRRLVLVESAINALSYHQLKPDPATRYLSTGGAFSKRQPELLRRAIRAMPPGSTIVLAFDHDAAGDEYSQELQTLVPEATYVRSAPQTKKDWNDVLQERESEYIASLSNQSDKPPP